MRDGFWSEAQRKRRKIKGKEKKKRKINESNMNHYGAKIINKARTLLDYFLSVPSTTYDAISGNDSNK